MQNQHDDNLLQTWQQGGLKPVILQPLTHAQCITLRSKLYRLRKRLIEESHPVALVASAATIKLYPVPTPTGGHWALMIHPSSMGFEQAFINAGIVTKDETEPPPLD